MTDTDLARAARIALAWADLVDATPGWADARHADLRSLAEELADGDVTDAPLAAALLAAARAELAPEIEEARLEVDAAYEQRDYALESWTCECSAEDVGHHGHRDACEVRRLEIEISRLRAEVAPRPRVWLPGDTVPAGVWVQDVDGGLRLSGLVECDEGPYVEVQTPSESTMAAAVAAEQARRAGGEVL